MSNNYQLDQIHFLLFIPFTIKARGICLWANRILVVGPLNAQIMSFDSKQRLTAPRRAHWVGGFKNN